MIENTGSYNIHPIIKFSSSNFKAYLAKKKMGVSPKNLDKWNGLGMQYSLFIAQNLLKLLFIRCFLSQLDFQWL